MRRWWWPGLLLVLLAPAWGQVEAPTRQPDAYNTWKLALAGQATDPAAITVPPGFQVELLRSALPEEDSWVSLAFDPEGRITVGCEKKGLLRLTLGEGGVSAVERIDDSLLECRGLLYAYGALYAVANNSKVVMRLRSTTSDGNFDERTELLRTEGGVGHGRNHLKLGPDGMIYLAHGNNVVAPPEALANSPLRSMQDDRLIPCPWDPQMFDGDVQFPAGHILRTDKDGKKWELVAGGFRNELDVAFNEDGEMFTFDADMEWDTGTPWYRPNRVNHVLPGADYGWRRGTSKWPEYFPDAGPTVVNIGLASPTAVLFGTKAAFPPKWQRALFICDWAYGRIMAVHLEEKGASYAGTVEPFIQGRPLNVTDAAVGPDGAFYFTTGGRRTQSGLYRVRYVGSAVKEEEAPRDVASLMVRMVRRTLEGPVPRKVEDLWPYLGSTDRWLRHAARVNLEQQPVAEWRELALGEERPSAALTALMALAHAGEKAALEPMLARLNALKWSALSEELKLLALRDYQLAFIRLGPGEDARRDMVRARLEALYPGESWEANHLLCELLVYLQSPAVVEKTMPLLEAGTRSQDLLHYLFYLRQVREGWTPERRQTYFTALNRADGMEGARDYQRSLRLIRAEVAGSLSAEEQTALGPLLAGPVYNPPPSSTGPQLLVKEWTEAELLPRLERVGSKRSLAGGQMAFATAQCVVCHRLGKTGGSIGPDLTGVGARFDRRALLDSILVPSRVVDEKYKETPMPPGLLNVLTEAQILDLLAYLESGGDPAHGSYR